MAPAGVGVEGIVVKLVVIPSQPGPLPSGAPFFRPPGLVAGAVPARVGALVLRRVVPRGAGGVVERRAAAASFGVGGPTSARAAALRGRLRLRGSGSAAAGSSTRAQEKAAAVVGGRG